MLFFFQAEDGIRDLIVTGVQTCALPISPFRRRMAAAISEAGIQQSPSEAMGASFPPGTSGAPQSWIERVAKGIAEEIRAEDGQADGDAREEHEVRRLLCVLRRGDGGHATPRRIRLWNAQPPE